MRTIITGAAGQLGQAIQRVLTAEGFEIIAALDVEQLDVADHTSVKRITDMFPELVIHCAALTNVDACAKDPDSAFKINAFGTQNVAHACLRCNAEMVYISTNEVFSGRADRPYAEADTPQPINPYGSSKRAGEQMAAKYLQDGLYVVRTAWLYGGGHMFPEKILAAAEKHGELRVVTDEVSNPTYTLDLARAVAALVQTHRYGIYHFTNAGHCSRFDFAREVLRLAGRDDVPVHPITLADYPRPSLVPPFTPLANTAGPAAGITLRPWQEALAEHLNANA
ncbi:MAG: dTDP-4-dehydrorhamnose reductase [Anaerolineae bacterium]